MPTATERGETDRHSNAEAGHATPEERREPVEREDVPGWLQVLKQLMLQPLCFWENDEEDLKAKLKVLESDLASEREHHQATLGVLHQLQEHHRQQVLQLAEARKENDKKLVEITHLQIERDTLKSALSSIFDANKMVKRDILHVDETQDVDDSPILSGVSTPSRRISMDHGHFGSPHSPRTHDVLHTVRNSLLSQGSTDDILS